MRFLLLIPLFVLACQVAKSQSGLSPSVKVGFLENEIKLNGVLDEPAWEGAALINDFRMVEPDPGNLPSFKSEVLVMADQKNLLIGIRLFDDEPKKMVAFSKSRDSDLQNEDYFKVVLDTYGDGRSAYIFAINPYGARYDALSSNRGEGEDESWDAIWEARTRITEVGWTAEIRIPINSLSFRKGLNAWGFNVERRVQRYLETNRWAAVSRDYKMAQTIHAGHLIDLPAFDLGIGLVAKAASMLNYNESEITEGGISWDNSLDLTQRITPDISAQLTMNTDFAETEVDTRRTNLTRFPLMFPEKRQFFLEGSDIYDFGLGMGYQMLAFQSRKIGLVDGQAVPLRVGGKVNGKISNTQIGSLVVHTGEMKDVVSPATMGVVRIKQNIFKESNIGMIGMVGDPLGRSGSWTGGVDFTYQNSTFMGNKNFLAGFWGLMTERNDLVGDKTAFGFKVDYPNDLWDVAIQYYRIGDAFDPSLGFIPRKGVSYYRLSANYQPRPGIWNIRQTIFQSFLTLYTDLENHWETYQIFTSPLQVIFESGDRFEFNVNPCGEYLKEEFEITDGVIIPSGGFHWNRYRLEAESSSKRRVNGQATWWFGGFYGGSLHQMELTINWRPLSFLVFAGNFERNIGSLPYGDFTQDLYAVRVQLNLSSNLNLSSFIQYDTDSRSFGTNNRFRWTFAPRGDLFIVYNHNLTRPIEERFWLYQSNQLIVKLVYGIGL